MKQRTKSLAAGLLLLGTATVVSGCASSASVGPAGSSSGGDSGAPGPAPTAAGQYRVLPPAGWSSCMKSCNLPPEPQVTVKDATGRLVGLVILPAAREDSPKRMQLRVCQYRKVGNAWSYDPGACQQQLVAEGSDYSAYGVGIHVLRLWWTEDEKSDALDVSVTAS